MEGAIELFIEFTELKASDPQAHVEDYKKLLRDIATGSWHFPSDFQKWRNENQRASPEQSVAD